MFEKSLFARNDPLALDLEEPSLYVREWSVLTILATSWGMLL